MRGERSWEEREGERKEKLREERGVGGREKKRGERS